MDRMPFSLLPWLIAWISLLASATGAQEQLPAADAPGSTPRDALSEYLAAARAGDFERAARYLDPRALRDQARELLARRLEAVLDRTVWIDLEKLSDDPEGVLDDGLPPDVERVATIQTETRGSVDLLMQRGVDPEGRSVWRFSAATVAKIPALYGEFGYGILGELLPDRFFAIRFLEIQLWQWIGLLLLVLAAFAVSWLATWTAYSLLQPLAARTRTRIDEELLTTIVKPLRLVVALALFSGGALLLRLAVPAQRFLTGLEKGLAVLVGAWLFLRLIDLGAGLLRERLAREGKLSAVAVLPLGEKTVKVVILAFALIALLQNLGFNVTGILAGLGIGGLAVALAAQKTVENLFGGVSLILDQPVRVGDFCRYGDKLGTVEDIGLRSIKLRSLDRTVVSVPNAEFANLQLENFARRDKIRFYTKLGLRYETTGDQLRWVLAEVRRLLLSHPKVDPDPARIRFVGYGQSSLDLELFAFVATPDFNEYLAIQEDLLLRIMDIVGASGTGFAFPSSTTYLARDGGLDAERAREAEARVRAWREKGALPFPDYPPEIKTEMDDSLAYPPEGSALAGR